MPSDNYVVTKKNITNNIKIILVINQRERDLRGVVLIAFWLNHKYGIMPIITSTRNELSCLIKHKPQMIITDSAKHDWQEEWLKYAKSQNTAVCIYPGEGLPLYPDGNDYLIRVFDYEKFPKYINLFMVWGPNFVNSLRNNPATNNINKVAVGVSRFDYYTEKYSSLIMPRSKYYKKIKLCENKKTLLWLTSTFYSNLEDGFDKFEEKIKKESTSENKSSWYLIPLAKDHQKVFSLLVQCMKNVINEFPDINVIIKVHPFENNKPYTESFGKCTNVRIITNNDIPLSTILKYSDVQLNWRCTTSSETWLTKIDKPVLTPNYKVSRPELEYLDYGNDPFDNYPSLKTKLVKYLNGKKVPLSLIKKREQFISEFLNSDKGNAAECCVDAIYKYISLMKSPQRSFYNYKQILKYLRSYRFNSNWLLSRRNENHKKYIPKEMIQYEMNVLKDLFNKNVDYLIEI